MDRQWIGRDLKWWDGSLGGYWMDRWVNRLSGCTEETEDDRLISGWVEAYQVNC